MGDGDCDFIGIKAMLKLIDQAIDECETGGDLAAQCPTFRRARMALMAGAHGVARRRYDEALAGVAEALEGLQERPIASYDRDGAA